jgi:hypothetical protein
MADQQDRPEPDHSDDPRSKDIGEGGYAEEQPGGQGSSSERQDPEAGRDDDDEAQRAPGTSSASESGPGEASGNPDNAGGG